MIRSLATTTIAFVVRDSDNASTCLFLPRFAHPFGLFLLYLACAEGYNTPDDLNIVGDTRTQFMSEFDLSNTNWNGRPPERQAYRHDHLGIQPVTFDSARC
jgi:hypothetical protein